MCILMIGMINYNISHRLLMHQITWLQVAKMTPCARRAMGWVTAVLVFNTLLVASAVLSWSYATDGEHTRSANWDLGPCDVDTLCPWELQDAPCSNRHNDTQQVMIWARFIYVSSVPILVVFVLPLFIHHMATDKSVSPRRARFFAGFLLLASILMLSSTYMWALFGFPNWLVCVQAQRSLSVWWFIANFLALAMLAFAFSFLSIGVAGCHKQPRQPLPVVVNRVEEA